MHIVQSKILDKLTYAEKLRYSQMRPERTESNLFAYHLKCLMKDGYIIKNDQNYTLSSKGKSYVDMISHQSLKVRHQPKIVTLLDMVNSRGETMIYRRKHQPYIDMLGYPSGKLHIDEKIEVAAQRELKEKLNMQNVELEHRGIVYVRIADNGVFISQVLAHVFHGKTDEEVPEKDVRRAERFWGNPNDFAKNDFIPGFEEIKSLLAGGEFFFDELYFDLADYR